MRLIACLICLLPGWAAAEPLTATSHVTAVTIFASGARVDREVRIDGKAGPQDVVVTDLPNGDALAAIRLLPAEGLTVGAFSGGRGGPVRPSLEQQAATDRVKALEAEERAALGQIDQINALIAAGDAKAGFLTSLGSGGLDLGGATATSLKEIADMAGAGVLAARQEAVAARADLLEAEAALSEIQTRLEQARAQRDEFEQDLAESMVLNLSVVKATDAPATLVISTYVPQASWQPTYDADLNRKDGTLTLERRMQISQQTGEDWSGVHLTLSTASLAASAEPSRLWPDAKRIEKEEPVAEEDGALIGMAAGMSEAMVEPEVAVEATGMILAAPVLQGETVVYDYPTPVTVPSGESFVQLSLDRLSFTPEISALAVPRRDDTAFLLAKLTNSSAEILLPGSVNLLRDGALVGTGQIDLLPPGVEAELGFGPIEGLRLTRRMPERAEGERGILTSSNQIEEKATLKIENKTGESWPVRLLDQVPYSEQEDLKISFTADPAPTETDVEGQRGILAWTFDLAAEASKEILLTHTISWPQGMVLQ